MYSQDIFTVTANLVGAPALSMPVFKHSNNMPFGLQIMAKSFDDHKVLDFSYYLEKKYKSQ